MNSLDYLVRKLRTEVEATRDNGNLISSVLSTVEAIEQQLAYAKTEFDKDSRSDYFSCCDSVAKEIFDRALEEADSKSKDDVEDWLRQDGYDALHESVDGNYWVIYTHAAMKVLQYSDNDNHGFEEGLICTEDWAKKGYVDYSAMAFWAMLADCQEALNDLLADYEEPEEA